VPDIVSQGGDRGPSPWPRWIVAAVVLVLVAVGLVRHFASPAPAGARPAGTDTTSALPAADSGAPVSVPARAVGPDGITGPVTPWSAGLALPSAGTRPAWFWPATTQPNPPASQLNSAPAQSNSAPAQSNSAPAQSNSAAGRFKAIGGLPPSSSGYQFTRTPAGWVVQAGPSAAASCGGCAEPPRPVYYLADAALTAHRVGSAYAVAPGATAGTLWLTSYPSGAGHLPQAGVAQQVSLAGAAVGAPVRLPLGNQIVQGTSRGLLLAPAAPQPGATLYGLWQPGKGWDTQVFSGVIAVSSGEIAWSPPCESDCQLHVLNLVTGREISAALPEAGSAANAAFSPDGRYLALQITYNNTGDDGALAIRLDVVTLPTGHLTVVPETFASSDAMVGFGWPVRGDTLVAELSFTTKVQLAAWHPGASRLSVATLTPRHAPPSLVIASAIP
jgi:hypothetical protein